MRKRKISKLHLERKKDIKIMQFWMQSQSCSHCQPTYSVKLPENYSQTSIQNSAEMSLNLYLSWLDWQLGGFTLVLYFQNSKVRSQKTLPCAGAPVVAFLFNLAALNRTLSLPKLTQYPKVHEVYNNISQIMRTSFQRGLVGVVNQKNQDQT